MALSTRHRCFAVCTPGLEAIAASELTAHGIRAPRATRGGVEFEATTRQLYASNLHLRTATRVLVRIGRFAANDFAAIERGAARLDWDRWLAQDEPVRVRAASSRSRLSHTGAIAQRVVAATRRPASTAGRDHPTAEAGDPGPAQVFVRVVDDTATVSVDSSGPSLFRRGWRQEVAKAPLRETLAAALLLRAPWDGTTPLLDPFCGSGTIAVEAALLARRIAPGRGRSFAFQRWPGFEPGTWASVCHAATTAERTAAPASIVASDRDEGAVRATLANAARAGVADDLDVACRSISALRAPPGGPGWLITNPPYGARLRGGDLRNLYARLGAVVHRELDGWSVGLLAADARLAGHAALALTPLLHTTNGGIAVTFLATSHPAA